LFELTQRLMSADVARFDRLALSNAGDAIWRSREQPLLRSREAGLRGLRRAVVVAGFAQARQFGKAIRPAPVNLGKWRMY